MSAGCSSLFCVLQNYSLGAAGTAVPGFYKPYITHKLLVGKESGSGKEVKDEEDEEIITPVIKENRMTDVLDRSAFTGVQSAFDQGMFDIDNIAPDAFDQGDYIYDRNDTMGRIHPQEGTYRQQNKQLIDRSHKFGVTQDRLIAAIPPIVIGAFIFVGIIAFFELLRTFYDETFVFQKENGEPRYKLTLERLPIFLLNIGIVLIGIVFVIKLFN